MRKVCISIGCFYARGKGDYYLAKNMDKVIGICSKLDIDGVELMFGYANALLKSRLTGEAISLLKNYDFNTFHAPFYAGYKKSFYFDKSRLSKKTLEKIYQIMDKIGAVNLNMHPEDVKDFSVFSKDYGHSIENMESSHELRYKDYDKILRQNDNFRLVIDTTHALYSGQLNGLFNRFRKKIVYSHLSMNYHEHLHLPLNIFSKERLNALNIIKKDKFPVVIESQTGDIEAKEYKKEVNFVRKWLNS